MMQIFRTCLISLLGGVCFLSHAEIEGAKLWVNPGFYSAHFDAQKGLRNANPGIGLEYQLDTAWRLTAGRFINSDNVQSNYLGAYYQPWKVGDLKIGVVGGVFNGYPKAFNGGWFPAVLPVASWESQRFGLNVAFVPPLEDRLYGAVSFQLKFRFHE
jgi:hypothetical protein